MGEGEAPAAAGVPARLPLTRREFLYYLWGASMALFMAEAGGAIVWFALPLFREGGFRGVFSVPVSEVPAPDQGPKEFPEGRFWLVNIGQQTVADARQPGDYPLEAGGRALSKGCTPL